MKKISGYTTRLTFFAAIIFSVLVISSCKSKKVTLIDSEGVLRSKTHNEVINDILSHELDYKTLTTKGSVSVKGKKLTTVFKLVKDEILQASVRIPIIGAEAMRIDITPEKIVLIDRLEGRYAEIGIKDNEMSDLAAFNFYNLQALLTNQLFLAGEHHVSKTDYERFEIKASDNKYLLQTKDRNNIEYLFSVNPSERIVSTLVNSPSRGVSLLWNYDQFVEDGTFVYPTDMTANIAIKDKKISVGISYADLDVNTDFSVDTSISSKYKKVELIELIGSYMKMK